MVLGCMYLVDLLLLFHLKLFSLPWTHTKPFSLSEIPTFSWNHSYMCICTFKKNSGFPFVISLFANVCKPNAFRVIAYIYRYEANYTLGQKWIFIIVMSCILSNCSTIRKGNMTKRDTISWTSSMPFKTYKMKYEQTQAIPILVSHFALFHCILNFCTDAWKMKMKRHQTKEIARIHLLYTVQRNGLKTL